MSASKLRRERRAALQVKFASGGYGEGNKVSKPASGQNPSVNPFMLPKASGLNLITQMFPDNYWVEWDLSTWRTACDQAQKMGYPISYAALVSWAFESSPFIQSLFVELGDGITKIPIYLVDEKGNRNELWTEEICNKRWFKDLRKEILWANMWGFTGLNIDPLNNRIYKYPMQNIDPINRMLRQSTYNFSDGLKFSDYTNLFFIQPSTSYERFLGLMQPITRAYIQMNMNSMNWIMAGRKLAFPLLTVGYPAASNEVNYNNELQNPFRTEAENYIASVDPSKALVSPYTRDRDGNIQQALIVDSKDTGAKQNAHKIYQEFNADEKNEIRELIMGGILTSTTGKFGSKGVGDTHENKLKTVLVSRMDEILAVLNDDTDFLFKLKKFYRNFPDNLRFDINKTKEFGIDEIKTLSESTKNSGLKLTPKFYQKYGLDPEDIEDMPQPVKPQPQEENLSVEFSKPEKSIFGLKKKY